MADDRKQRPQGILAAVYPTRGLLAGSEYVPRGLLDTPYGQENIYRGTILPFEKNMDTGQVNMALPGLLGGAIDSAVSGFTAPRRAMTGELPMTDDAGRTSPQAIASATDLAGLLTLGSGALPANINDLRMGLHLMHASPHDFDKFERSAATRLSGEGNSTFGDGLYFAENPKVADSYVEQFKSSHGRSVYYKVDFDVKSDDVLDMDKPLKDQSKKIRDSVLSLMPKEDTPFDWMEGIDDFVPSAAKTADKDNSKLLNMTGGEAYVRLEQALGSKEAASDALSKSGIPGMRYFDQGSREAQQGTRNYIVFDPEKLKVLDKKTHLPQPDPDWLKAMISGNGA